MALKDLTITGLPEELHSKVLDFAKGLVDLHYEAMDETVVLQNTFRKANNLPTVESEKGIGGIV